MILPTQTLRAVRPLKPFHERRRRNGMTYGVGPASYDVRIAESYLLWPGRCLLASTMEYFDMPDDIAGEVKDKSTWARRFITLQNTFIDPGFKGYLTLEITNHSWGFRRLNAGDPIAQIVFYRLEAPTEMAYAGKYQNQAPGPQAPRYEP